MSRGHVNEQLHTTLANTGRVAGMGINYDRYDDESGCPSYESHEPVMFPSDYLKEDELEALNGPVISYKLASKTFAIMKEETVLAGIM